MECQSEISYSFNQSRVGSELEVLVDDVSGGKLICRSQYDSPEVDGEIFVKVPDGVDARALVGNFIKVRVTSADLYDLCAEII